MVDFYQHNIIDWEAGTKEMPFELEAFYRKLCDQIYSFTDELPDDDHLVARLTKLSVRKYRSLKNELISIGKIQVVHGLIRNPRCTEEVTKILSLSDLMREKAAKSHSKRRLNKENKTAKVGELSSKNNETDIAGANAQALANSGTSELPLLRNGADAQNPDPKKELFNRAIVVLGGSEKTARSLCGRLLKSKSGSIPLARAALETAATMGEPRQYIGGVLKANGDNGLKFADGVHYDPRHPCWVNLKYPGETSGEVLRRLGFVPFKAKDGRSEWVARRAQDGMDEQPSPFPERRGVIEPGWPEHLEELEQKFAQAKKDESQ